MLSAKFWLEDFAEFAVKARFSSGSRRFRSRIRGWGPPRARLLRPSHRRVGCLFLHTARGPGNRLEAEKRRFPSAYSR